MRQNTRFFWASAAIVNPKFRFYSENQEKVSGDSLHNPTLFCCCGAKFLDCLADSVRVLAFRIFAQILLELVSGAVALSGFFINPGKL